jgi:photosystem II stability/assembly factor-like uncharacterized protein
VVGVIRALRVPLPVAALSLLALGASFACAPPTEPHVAPRPSASASSSASPPPAPPPVDPALAAKRDALLARYVDARGGADKLRAIASLRTTGTARFGDASAAKMTYASVYKRGAAWRTRSELTNQGITGVSVFDGQGAWRTSPRGGRRDPFRLSADEAKGFAHAADLDGPLVDWQSKGHRVDYMGIDDVDGTPAHKLRVIYKDGDVEYRYLDPDALLEIRIVREQKIRGVEHVTEIDVGDYEQVAGVWIATSLESGAKGEPRTARFTIDRVEANVDVDDAVFAFPAAGTRVERVIPAPGPSSAAATPPPPAPSAALPVFDSGVVSGLGARNIGSARMSGRIAAVDAHAENGKTTVYVGSASGGVWKSRDGGTTFDPVFDKQPVQSIGAVAIDPSHPDTVWVGTGEAWTRNSVSIGDGIYKSVDAGATWTKMGLPDSERIARIVIHPTNGDVVYACVPGKLWSDSADRGVYKTSDGGKTWSLVLKGANLSTGCSGLSIDPKAPDVLVAGMWDFRRKGWTSRSGGDGPDAPSASGMFRTSDGGATWTAMTAASNKGLPPAPWGRVEVAIAPSNPKMIYALVESKDSALFVSEDGGATWEQRDKSQSVVWRPFYFARLVVDPTNASRVFKPNLALVVSEDAGKSFARTGGGAHGDWHDLWIDPTNPKHVIGGDDGGLWISWDGGSRWWKSENLPVSQFYHVSVDDRDPYLVYGGLQDNATWVAESSYPGGISNGRWENLYVGDGFWALVDPTDRDAVYVEFQGGHMARVDRRTHATRDLRPTAGFKEKLRFNWNSPIHASPTKKGTIYIGAQFLFRSTNHGDSWERISPDLSTNDPEKQKQEQSGGVTVDNSSAETHTSIYTISESPKDSSVLWVGTDDGNVQLSRDAGKTWNNVVANVPSLPKNSWVSWIEASRYDAATAYAAFDRHSFGEMTPWVFKTSDYGKTWTRIVGPDQGVRGYAHVIKEDVVSPSLLFLGTEFGLWISIDGGAKWAEFKGGEFPSVAVRDIQVHPRDGDLVLATHGRGIWIVDDVSPLRALSSDVLAKPAAFLAGRVAQQRLPTTGGWAEGDAVFSGQNPPDEDGAVVTYYERARHIFGRFKLEITDEKGNVIDTVTATKRRGINRVVWSMRIAAPRVPRAATTAENATHGPRVLPGTYTLRLTRGKEVVESKLEVRLDRRATYGMTDRKAQFDLMMKAHALFGDMSALVDRIDNARTSLEVRAKSLAAADALRGKIDSALAKLVEAKKKIVATKEGGAITGEERIREHLDDVYGALDRFEGRPTKYQTERVAALAKELAEVAADVDAIMKNDVTPITGAK